MKRFAIVTTACAAVALGMTFSAGSANAAGGTISGTVKYDGTPPAPKTVEVTKDKEVCGLSSRTSTKISWSTATAESPTRL